MCKALFRLVVLSGLLAAALGVPRAASAVAIIRHAKPVGGLNTGSCSTWATACTLQRALGVALAGDQVWVKKGIYRPSTSLIVKSGVKVYGGFAGAETVLTARKPGVNITILSGDTGADDKNTDGNFIAETTNDIVGTNMGPVVMMNGTSTPVTATTVLDGFTITAGYATGSGGGLYCNASLANSVCSPTVGTLVFSGNYAYMGGGMHNDAQSGGIGSPTLTNVLFRGNRAGICGGGLANRGASGISSPKMNSVTFNNNSAASYGGALCNYAESASGISSPVMTGGAFNNNSAGLYGGAVINWTATGTSKAQFTNVAFRGNQAGDNGGAVFDWSQASGPSSPLFYNVTFAGNHAASWGGAIYNAGTGGDASPTLMNVTFSANTAGGQGGAMYNWGWNGISSPEIINVTFNANSASQGGAMAGTGTGGASSPAIINSILWGNIASAGPELYNIDAIPTIDHSIVKGGDTGIGGNSGLTAWSSGTGNLQGNPLLSVLGSYGGPTQTMPLKYGSPAIDHGTNTVYPSKDQRGIPRPSDGDGDGAKICDMGATEGRRLTTSFRSVGSYDGWVLESSENSGVGGSMNSTAETFNLGDDASNRQYRAILSFSTGSLPDTSRITAVTIKVLKSGLVGADPFNTLGNILLDIRKGAFGTGAALDLTDFQAAASKTAASAIPNTPVSGWYSRALPSTSLGYINKTGITQFRLRFKLDDNNNTVANYISFYSGNAASANRPVLTIKYYAP